MRCRVRNRPCSTVEPDRGVCHFSQEGDGISITAIREIMLLRYLSHANIVRLESVHIHRAEPSLWLAFDYAEHDLHDLIRHHITSSKEVREVRDMNRGERQNTLPGGVWQVTQGPLVGTWLITQSP